uniref:Putative group II intron maturase n=1 Tax=Netrium digitus TaxID=43946 RepID=A0A191T593_9VIRI|nr:putative group II intron maturase [Netrium digitus]ANI25552.1 putative group II intron maturase [Netrium digitus]
MKVFQFCSDNTVKSILEIHWHIIFLEQQYKNYLFTNNQKQYGFVLEIQSLFFQSYLMLSRMIDITNQHKTVKFFFRQCLKNTDTALNLITVKDCLLNLGLLCGQIFNFLNWISYFLYEEIQQHINKYKFVVYANKYLLCFQPFTVIKTDALYISSIDLSLLLLYKNINQQWFDCFSYNIQKKKQTCFKKKEYNKSQTKSRMYSSYTSIRNFEKKFVNQPIFAIKPLIYFCNYQIQSLNKQHLLYLKKYIFCKRAVIQKQLIYGINQIINLWNKYLETSLSKIRSNSFYLNYVLNKYLRYWGVRRHHKKTKKWVSWRYWYHFQNHICFAVIT